MIPRLKKVPDQFKLKLYGKIEDRIKVVGPLDFLFSRETNVNGYVEDILFTIILQLNNQESI